MKPIIKLFFMVSILGGMYSIAYAEYSYNVARGQLLYATHCNACHTTQIHWREQKLVTDWNSLTEQINRWQSVAGLGWSKDEIKDVAHYLNGMFYEYKDTAQGKDPKQFLFKE